MGEEEEEENPKAFISYSWGSQEHEEWVIDLAEKLVENGVDVTFDKWDLSEGDEAVNFMERMVKDPEIEKVIIISDKDYTKKADNREGGVGKETQIISKKIYDNVEQDKFVVVVSEKDEDGKPYLPTFYEGRIYIDLSDPGTYGENFEKLLRWIYDEPIHEKPELGTKPSFLDEENNITLGTTVSFRNAVKAIKKEKTSADGVLGEYFETFAENLEKFRIEDCEDEFDDVVVKNIEDFIPYRNNIINIFSTIARYNTEERIISKIHSFFESLIPYMFRPPDVSSSNRWDYDNFRFIIREMFLYAIAIFVKHERFEAASNLLNRRYYVPDSVPRHQDNLVSYTIFWQPIRSLIHRNKRLELKRLSLKADLLKQRSETSGIKFRYLMQADFIAYMRSELDEKEHDWWPETLVYLSDFPGPFEIFARAEDKEYFEKIKCLFGGKTIGDLKQLVEEYKERERSQPQWGHKTIDPGQLLNIKKIGSQPSKEDDFA